MSGYTSPYWPHNANREHYRAAMRAEYPNRSEAVIEELAKAGAMIAYGGRRFVAETPAIMGFEREPATGLIHLDEAA